MKKLYIILAAVAVVMTGCYSDPVADFRYSPKDPVAGEDIFFENLSYDAGSFQWEFGDGVGSSAYDPIHSFKEGGTYTVTLKAFGNGSSGIDVAYATINVVSVEPYADFYVTTDLPYENGMVAVETDMVFVGEQVTFNNISTDAAAVLWDFGDDYTSTEYSPSWSYDAPGTYTVTLNAYGLGDEHDSYQKTIIVADGINSTIRITVKEYWDEYPVENARVLLFPTYADWLDSTNYSDQIFTTELGKCIFEGLFEQRYYIDVYKQPDNQGNWYDNYLLEAEEDGVIWIETQVLEADYIHDFTAYVDIRNLSDKKTVLQYVSRKERLSGAATEQKRLDNRAEKGNKFSKER